MSEPLWETVAAQLRAEIENGTLAPGETLPAEKDLAVRFGCSRDTVRRGLRALLEGGLVTEGHGRLGRKVRESTLLRVYASQYELLGHHRPGTDAWMSHTNGHAAGQAIRVSTEPADALVAGLLGIEEGEQVVARRRTRYLGGTAHNLNDTYYPGDIAIGTPVARQEDVTEGVIVYLAGIGHEQVRSVDTVTARMPGPDEARELSVPPGVPLIIQVRTGWSSERPIRAAITRWPADRAELVWDISS